MKGWVEDIKILASIAKDDPQSAFAAMAMVFPIQHPWRYIQRTVPNISALFKDLENEIHHRLLPAIVGREISSEERDIIALPARYGGMGILKPEEWSDFEFEASKKVTEKLKALIIRQDFDTNINATEIVVVKREVKNEKEILWKTKYETICAELNTSTKRALDNAQQKGASSWLTSLPIAWLGFVLNKQEFRDSISLRYNWHIDNVPNYCGCGSANNIDHCLTCRHGGYVVMRHNQIRDTIADVMKEVCHDVQVEPHLIPIEGESLINSNASTEDNARLDVSGRGVWAPFDRTFIDIRVTHPNCRSNREKPLSLIYQQHENEKKRKYNERVLNVERGSCTPAVFLTTGGMSPECKRFVNRLADLYAVKQKINTKRWSDIYAPKLDLLC